VEEPAKTLLFAGAPIIAGSPFCFGTLYFWRAGRELRERGVTTQATADGALGMDRHDQGSGIAADSSGNAYVAGYTSSTDFPTANPVSGDCVGTCGTGGNDAFLAKLNPVGSAPAPRQLSGEFGFVTPPGFGPACLAPSSLEQSHRTVPGYVEVRNSQPRMLCDHLPSLDASVSACRADLDG